MQKMHQKRVLYQQEHEEIQFNVDTERGTEQQANSSKQRQTKKHTF